MKKTILFGALMGLALGAQAQTVSTASVTLGYCLDATSQTNLTKCLPFTWNGHKITEPVVQYPCTLQTVDGCDSIAYLTLTKARDIVPEEVEICNTELPYTWHNIDRTTSGTYTWVDNTDDCGCVDTLILTVKQCCVSGRINDKAKFNIGTNQNPKYVYFSKGNVQYQASTGTWRFAEHQYDFVGGTTDQSPAATYGNVSGSNNNLIASDYSGWIDLFGWGANGKADMRGIVVNAYQAGLSNDPFANSNSYNPLGNNDWGNNEFQEVCTGSTWRTLTDDEWKNFASCNTHYWCTVEDVQGMLFTPVGFQAISGITLANNSSYSGSNWTALENAGCLFLPRAGSRDEDWRGPYYILGCRYWCDSQNATSNAVAITFTNNTYSTQSEYKRYGFAVRLVQDAQ